VCGVVAAPVVGEGKITMVVAKTSFSPNTGKQEPLGWRTRPCLRRNQLLSWQNSLRGSDFTYNQKMFLQNNHELLLCREVQKVQQAYLQETPKKVQMPSGWSVETLGSPVSVFFNFANWYCDRSTWWIQSSEKNVLR
jgi:hypothetical protein